MKELEKYMPLKENEQIYSVLQGDCYNMSSDPISRLVGSLIRIISIITGSRKRAIIVVTSSRMIKIETQKLLWFIDNSVSAISLTPRSISTVGYSLSRSLIIFKSHYFELVSSGLTTLVKSENGKDGVYKTINCATHITQTA